MTESINPRDEEIEAIARLAGTRDGMLLHRYLRRVLENCRVTEESGALQRSEGARILARDLMSHMAPGIEGTSGRTDDSPILTGPAGSGSRRRPAGSRRVDPDPAVAAFLAANGADEA